MPKVNRKGRDDQLTQVPTLRDQMAQDFEDKTTLDTAKLHESISNLGTLKAKREEMSTMLAKLDEQIKDIETDIIPNLLDNCGVSKMTFEGYSIEVKTEIHPHVLKENESEWFDWLHINGFAELIKNEVKVMFGKGEDEKAIRLVTNLSQRQYDVTQKMTIHSGTLKAFVKEQLDKQDKGAGVKFPAYLNINPVRTTIIK